MSESEKVEYQVVDGIKYTFVNGERKYQYEDNYDTVKIRVGLEGDELEKFEKHLKGNNGNPRG